MNLREDIETVVYNMLYDEHSSEELDYLVDVLMDTYYDYDRAKYVIGDNT